MSDVESPSRARPEWAGSALASEFERLPRIGVAESVRRYWLLVLLPVVLLVAAAAFVAERRPSTYTAEARLQVGRLNISSTGAIAGFTDAALTLAANYSRAITADGVVNPVAKRFHTTPAAIRSRLSSTPIPSSPIVSVFATGTSESEAVRLANAGSAALVAYLVRTNKNDPDARNLLQKIHAAELSYQQALAAKQRDLGAKRNANVISSGPQPLDARGQQLAANVETARIQLDSLEAAYQSTVGSEAVSSLLQPLTSAHSATSNHSKTLQIALFAALVLGLVVGVALATLRANVVAHRALTSYSWELDGSGAPDKA